MDNVLREGMGVICFLRAGSIRLLPKAGSSAKLVQAAEEIVAGRESA